MQDANQAYQDAYNAWLDCISQSSAPNPREVFKVGFLFGQLSSVTESIRLSAEKASEGE